MAAKVKVKINIYGVRAMLNSAGAVSVCMSYAQGVLRRAGAGYTTGVRHYARRAGVAVFPETQEAWRDNMNNNTLLKSL